MESLEKMPDNIVDQNCPECGCCMLTDGNKIYCSNDLCGYEAEEGLSPKG